MSPRSLARLLVAPAVAGALVAGPLTLATPAGAATVPRTVATAAAATSTWQPRPEQYTQTSVTKDLAIPMSDGVKLRGDLTLPANADGTPIGAKVPVIVTITAYNKTVIAGGFGGTLAGADPAYLVKRGYQQLTVDARGTGASEGIWGAFSRREGKDAVAVVDWASRQPWSNERVRHDRPLLHGHQPDLRRGRSPARPQGDLPAGAGRRRLPRRRGQRRPDRRRLHPAVARHRDRHRADPAGVRGERAAARLPVASRQRHDRDHLHRHRWPPARCSAASRPTTGRSTSTAPPST